MGQMELATRSAEPGSGPPARRAGQRPSLTEVVTIACTRPVAISSRPTAWPGCRATISTPATTLASA